jgi:hypothetical protein
MLSDQSNPSKTPDSFPNQALVLLILIGAFVNDSPMRPEVLVPQIISPPIVISIPLGWQNCCFTEYETETLATVLPETVTTEFCIASVLFATKIVFVDPDGRPLRARIPKVLPAESETVNVPLLKSW